MVTAQVLFCLIASQGTPPLGPCDAWKPAIAQVNDLIAKGLASADDLNAVQSSESRCLAYHPGDPLPAWARELAKLPGASIQAQQNCAEAQQTLDSQRRQTSPQLQEAMRRQGQVPEYMEDSDAHMEKCINKRLSALSAATVAEIQALFAGMKARHEAAVEAAKAAAEQQAKGAEEAKFLKDHPEVPAQAISAVLCRTEQYRKWVFEQVEKDKHYSKIGGTINLRKRYQFQQLVRFLDEKKAEATRVLKENYRRKPLACTDRQVKVLATCVVPPTLMDADESEFVKDPPQTCGFNGALDRYSSDDKDSPSSGWFLGIAWFQPTSAGDGAVEE